MFSETFSSQRQRTGKWTGIKSKEVAGKKEHLLGKLQEHYGILKEDAEKQIDKWAAKISHDHCEKSP
jgi:uncharacterized protein YjbJ (UPF0337 family)